MVEGARLAAARPFCGGLWRELATGIGRRFGWRAVGGKWPVGPEDSRSIGPRVGVAVILIGAWLDRQTSLARFGGGQMVSCQEGSHRLAD